MEWSAHDPPVFTSLNVKSVYAITRPVHETAPIWTPVGASRRVEIDDGSAKVKDGHRAVVACDSRAPGEVRARRIVRSQTPSQERKARSIRRPRSCPICAFSKLEDSAGETGRKYGRGVDRVEPTPGSEHERARCAYR